MLQSIYYLLVKLTMWLSVLLSLHLHYLQLLQSPQVVPLDIQEILRHLSHTQGVIRGGRVIRILSAQWYLLQQQAHPCPCFRKTTDLQILNSL